MSFGTKVIAALVPVTAVLTQTPATALPCDNTRWCAQYSGRVPPIADSSPLSSAGQP
jgi:hypothetical protein